MLDWTLVPYAILLAATAVTVARLHRAPARRYLRGSLLLLLAVAAVAVVAIGAMSAYASVGPGELVPATMLLFVVPVAAALVVARVAGRFGRTGSVGAAVAAYLAALVAAVVGVIDLGLVR